MPLVRPSAAVVAAACAFGIVPSLGAAELDLRRVLLSSGGVGYFEYQAEVTGDAEVTLTVRRDQVDDVLKSIVVYDDRGGVGGISLPGEAPLGEVFRELPFEQPDLESPLALLQALRGAEVRIEGPRTLQGRIVAVVPESTTLANGGSVTRHRLSLLTAAGLSSVVIEEVESLRFADADLQARMEGALAGVARHGERERRQITVKSSGAGPRTLRVGYVVEVPLWKASYRLTLPAGSGTAELQAWAVLENLSGEAWRGVDLALVSGNPVTFRQSLYAAYFVDRPEVPVEVLGRVLPPPDPGAVPLHSRLAQLGDAESAPAEKAFTAGRAAAMASATPPQRPAALAAAEASEVAAEIRFTLPRPVDLEAGHSLLLPIVDRPVPVQRLALYRHQTQPRHPLAALEISNDGGSALPPGVLTLYDRDEAGRITYLGDARLTPFAAGEKRLVSFAVEQAVTVDREQRGASRIAGARLADGILQVEVTEQQQTVYRFAGAAGRAHRLLIEHPRPGPDWQLVAPDPKAAELVPDAWRLRHDLPAGGGSTLTVTLERPVAQRFVLADLGVEQIGAYASAAAFTPEQRGQLARLGALKRASAEREAALRQIESRRAALAGEQARVRENLEAVPAESDLHRRYLSLLGEQEDRLAALEREAADAQRALDAARRELAEFVRTARF